MTTTASASAKINNGVNVDALLGARTALEQAPEAAQFKWRASCEWLNGTHSRSAIGNFSGLASCLTAGVAAVAQRRGIQLHAVKASLEADMDIQGILGIDDEVRNGFGAIRVHFDIKADASEDEIKALVAQSQKRSAVFDIVTNPTSVFVTVN